MLIALLNAAAYYTSKAAEAATIAQAVNLQLHRHVAPAWGQAPWSCVFYPSAAQVPAGAYRLWLLDNADQADALGYHDVDPHGMAYGKVFVETIFANGGTSITGDTSVSVTTSHEALEIAGDPEANVWCQAPDGDLVALELCDPVEADSYLVTVGSGVAIPVSNFITPQYFAVTPVHAAKFDYLGRLTSPFSMTRWGYQIVMRGGAVSQKFGDVAHYPAWRLHGKQHVASRTQVRRARAA